MCWPGFFALAVLGIFLGWTVLIGMRLVWLQVIRHHEFVERAAKQQQRTFNAAPRRAEFSTTAICMSWR